MNEKDLDKIMKNRGFTQILRAGDSIIYSNRSTNVLADVSLSTKEFTLYSVPDNMTRVTLGKASPIDSKEPWSYLYPRVAHYAKILRENVFRF